MLALGGAEKFPTRSQFRTRVANSHAHFSPARVVLRAVHGLDLGDPHERLLGLLPAPALPRAEVALPFGLLVAAGAAVPASHLLLALHLLSEKHLKWTNKRRRIRATSELFLCFVRGDRINILQLEKVHI